MLRMAVFDVDLAAYGCRSCCAWPVFAVLAAAHGVSYLLRMDVCAAAHYKEEAKDGDKGTYNLSMYLYLHM